MQEDQMVKTVAFVWKQIDSCSSTMAMLYRDNSLMNIGQVPTSPADLASRVSRGKMQEGHQSSLSSGIFRYQPECETLFLPSISKFAFHSFAIRVIPHPNAF
jgi:hypothetical protein